MIHHVVLWAFRESVAPSERDEIVRAIRDLPSRVPGIRSLVVGENVSPARAQGFTHALVDTFDDREALRRYGEHPEHTPLVARLRDAADKMVAVDIEDRP